MDTNAKILFITRKYPPMVGGMEQLSFAIANELKTQAGAEVISWGGKQVWLPLFLPYSFLKTMYLRFAKGITHVHLGDALLAPMGVAIKYLLGVKVSTTVCGLDITFDKYFYQKIVPPSVNLLDKAICISNATLKECLDRNIKKEKCIFIPCGINPEGIAKETSREELQKLLNRYGYDINVSEKKFIITMGRLVKRKGVLWFVNNVMRQLNENITYLVVGDGEDKEAIKQSIISNGFEDRVLMLGRAPDEELYIALNTADVFVMPNIKVKDDMEGFGIVSLEALSTGIPCVLSELEGIEATKANSQLQIFVGPENPNAFVEAIDNAINIKRDKSLSNIDKFRWENIGKEYIEYILG